jgi:hypothetical protein
MGAIYHTLELAFRAIFDLSQDFQAIMVRQAHHDRHPSTSSG